MRIQRLSRRFFSFFKIFRVAMMVRASEIGGIPVKIALKELDNEKDGNRIYTLEAIDFALEEKK
jgi:hypothetical protein